MVLLPCWGSRYFNNNDPTSENDTTGQLLTNQNGMLRRALEVRMGENMRVQTVYIHMYVYIYY